MSEPVARTWDESADWMPGRYVGPSVPWTPMSDIGAYGLRYGDLGNDQRFDVWGAFRWYRRRRSGAREGWLESDLAGGER